MTRPTKHECTAVEAAAILGISVSELLELAGEGKIPQAVLDADGWRFRRTSIEKLRERRVA